MEGWTELVVNVDKGDTDAHLQNTYLPIMVRLVQSRAKLINVNNESACSVIPALLVQGQCPDGNSQRTKQRSGNSFLPSITNRRSEADQGVGRWSDCAGPLRKSVFCSESMLGFPTGQLVLVLVDRH